ncbi:hypothetical protein OGATHE_004244 [Ogataea polymorpha]|uniref:Uncharacterized protein n=1 Tax=Ogataea polymorpha TaxID=460523 RepID=A0A9P8P106_9ASCO|nr:hypothetical protein OGATHE_004244 [Ogataea polymorpha]
MHLDLSVHLEVGLRRIGFGVSFFRLPSFWGSEVGILGSGGGTGGSDAAGLRNEGGGGGAGAEAGFGGVGEAGFRNEGGGGGGGGALMEAAPSS